MIQRALVVGTAPPQVRIAGLGLEERRRLALADAGVRVGGEGPGSALVMRASTFAPPALIARLARFEPASEEVVATGGAGVRIYVAGAAAVTPLLSDLAAGREPSSREAPLHEREFVVHVGDQADARRAEDLLLKTLLKPSDGLVSRHLNRHLSLALTRRLVATLVTPNHMTLVAFVIGLAGAAWVYRGGGLSLIGGALLFQVQSILDGCDGEIARLKHLRSRLGEWLDQVADDVVNLAFLAAVAVALTRAGVTWTRPVGWVAAISLVINMVALYAAHATVGGGSGSVTSVRWWGQGAAAKPAPQTAVARLVRRLQLLFVDLRRRDFFTFFYLLTALVGHIELAFAWHALIALISGVGPALQWIVAGGPEPAPR